MFKVIEKETGKIHTVYGLAGAHFLLWDSELGWCYDHMDKYKPCSPEEENRVIMSLNLFNNAKREGEEQ